MSTKNLQLFLEYLVDDLERRDQDFRTSVANKQEHILTTSGTRIYTQTLKELQARDIKITPEEAKFIKKEANIAFRKISNKVENVLKRHETKYKQSRHKETRFTHTSLVAVFQIAEGHQLKLFEKTTRTYKDAINAYYFNIKTKLLDRIEEFPEKTGEFFQGGHAQDQGVFEFRVTKAVETALHDIGDYNLLEFVEGSRTKVAYTLRAIMSKDADRMSIIIESAKENQKDQSKILKKKNMFLNAAKSAIDRITSGKGFVYFKGSDSPIEAKRKQAVDAIIEPFEKIKGVKIKKESTKPNKSRGKATLKVKQKITRKKARAFPVNLSGGRASSKNTSTISLIEILTEVNTKLHRQLLKNMTKPALVYRSGTFARSVNAIGYDTTAKGFSTILYEFEPDPYNVFTAGRKNAWNTPQRDPDVLIDKSIREIVAGRLGARFFTRRVQ